MNVKYFILLNVFFIATFSTGIEDLVQNRVINYLLKYIIDRPRYRLTTVLCKTPQKLSLTSIKLMRRIEAELPTLFVNTTELQTTWENSDHLQLLRRWLGMRHHRKTFNIFFVENIYEQEAKQVLIEQLSILMNVSCKSTRPRCVIFLINSKESVRLKDFFKFSWSHGYLDIVVIEVLTAAANRSLSVANDQNLTVQFHQYNPFNDTYYVHNFLDRAMAKRLFVDKLYNLNGYRLSAGMYHSIPFLMLERNYTGDELWDIAHGLDVTITRELAKTLNFTPWVEVVTSNNLNLMRFNISNQIIRTAMTSGKIDFVVNFQGMTGNNALDENFFESTIFLYPYSSNLVVKLYGKYTIKLSANLVIIGCTILSTLMIFNIVIRLLRMNKQFWTTYNVLSILAGNVILVKFNRIYERILFSCLIAVSMTFSVNILEQLLEIFLWQDVFPDLTYLQDVIDHDIVPSVIKRSKREIQSHNNTALKTILRYSTPMEEENVADCINQLINNDTVDGCETDSYVGDLVAKSFSNTEREWIIDLVEEPIVQPCWTAMILTKTSPYVYRFNEVLRRFLESGLINFWFHKSMRNFIFTYKNYFGGVRLQGKDPVAYGEYFVKEKRTNIDLRIGWILIVGYAIAWIVFTIEFIVGQRKQNRISRRFDRS